MVAREALTFRNEGETVRPRHAVCTAARDPLQTLPIRAFERNHCKLGGIDQDFLEYLYSGAALS